MFITNKGIIRTTIPDCVYMHYNIYKSNLSHAIYFFKLPLAKVNNRHLLQTQLILIALLKTRYARISICIENTELINNTKGLIVFSSCPELKSTLIDFHDIRGCFALNVKLYVHSLKSCLNICFIHAIWAKQIQSFMKKHIWLSYMQKALHNAFFRTIRVLMNASVPLLDVSDLLGLRVSLDRTPHMAQCNIGTE